MKRTVPCSRALAALGCLFCLLGQFVPVGAAHASGLLVARFGGEWGHPMTDGLTSIYYNPAGLALMRGTRLELTGSFAWRDFVYNRNPEAIDNVLEEGDTGTGTPLGEGVALNSGRAHLLNFLATPFVGAGTDFGVEGLGVAIGMYVPLGGQSIWDQGAEAPDFPGASDGPQRWWTVEGTIRSIYGSLGVGYRIPKIRLSVGAALNLVLSEVYNLQARDADGTDHMTSGEYVAEGRVLVDVNSLDVALGVGLLWEPIDNLFIGASYQSQPGFGDQRLTGTVSLALGSGPIGAGTKNPAELRQAMPDVIRFGVRYGEPESWEVRLFGNVARWSVLKEQCTLNSTIADRSCEGASPPGKIIIVPRDWQDGWEIRAGGSYWLNPDVEMAFGVGFDSNAIPDKTLEPAIHDSDKLTLTLATRIKLMKQLSLHASYSQVIYFDRTVAPRGRVPADPNDPDGATITDLASTGYREALRTPDAAGSYHIALGLLEIGLTAQF